MIVSLVAAAVLDRLESDTGSGGLYEGGTLQILTGIYTVTGTPSQLAMPYAVMELAGQQSDAMDADTQEVTITLRVYDLASAALVNIDKVLTRVYGDAVAQSGRVPSYGLHRHVLGALPTNTWGAVGGQMLHVSQRIYTADENVLVAETVYRLHVNATATSP